MKIATRIIVFITALSMLPFVAATAQEGVLEIEEIVVTARKRNESLQDVPIAITAMRPDALVALSNCSILVRLILFSRSRSSRGVDSSFRFVYAPKIPTVQLT